MGYYPNDPLRKAAEAIKKKVQCKIENRERMRLGERAAAGDREAVRQIRKLRKAKKRDRKCYPPDHGTGPFGKRKRDPLAPPFIPEPVVSGGAFESNRRRH